MRRAFLAGACIERCFYSHLYLKKQSLCFLCLFFKNVLWGGAREACWPPDAFLISGALGSGARNPSGFGSPSAVVCPVALFHQYVRPVPGSVTSVHAAPPVGCRAPSGLAGDDDNDAGPRRPPGPLTRRGSRLDVFANPRRPIDEISPVETAVAGADEEPDPGADAVPDAAARACVEIKISRAPSGPNYLLFSDADRPSDALRDRSKVRSSPRPHAPVLGAPQRALDREVVGLVLKPDSWLGTCTDMYLLTEAPAHAL